MNYYYLILIVAIVAIGFYFFKSNFGETTNVSSSSPKASKEKKELKQNIRSLQSFLMEETTKMLDNPKYVSHKDKLNEIQNLVKTNIKSSYDDTKLNDLLETLNELKTEFFNLK